MVTGGPYREVWEYYRYLGETKPPTASLPTPQKKFWQGLPGKIKQKLSLKPKL